MPHPEAPKSDQLQSNSVDTYSIDDYDPKHPEANSTGYRNLTYPISSFNALERHPSNALKHAKSIAKAIANSPHSTPTETALAQCILVLCRNTYFPNPQ